MPYNTIPGLNRSFVSEDWDLFDKKVWSEVRDEARSVITNDEFRILASDINFHNIKRAKENAQSAGVADYIAFQKLDFRDFSSKRKYGCLIINPPYGQRLGENEEVVEMYEDLGHLFKQLDEWSFFVLTAHPQFEKIFGTKSTKNRKLYNGNLQCYYYQYFKHLSLSSPIASSLFLFEVFVGFVGIRFFSGVNDFFMSSKNLSITFSLFFTCDRVSCDVR